MGEHEMALWHDTMDEIGQIVEESGRELSIDQRIAIAQAHAMLAISQDLSVLNETLQNQQNPDH